MPPNYTAPHPNSNKYGNTTSIAQLPPQTPQPLTPSSTPLLPYSSTLLLHYSTTPLLISSPPYLSTHLLDYSTTHLLPSSSPLQHLHCLHSKSSSSLIRENPCNPWLLYLKSAPSATSADPQESPPIAALILQTTARFLNIPAWSPCRCCTMARFDRETPRKHGVSRQTAAQNLRMTAPRPQTPALSPQIPALSPQKTAQSRPATAFDRTKRR